MSGATQNLEVGYAGQTIFLDIRFYTPGNVLTDPDAIPTYSIYSPTNVLIVSGQASKLSLGFWQAAWFIPLTAALGVYKIVWTAQVGGQNILNNVEAFNVLDPSQKPITQSCIIEEQWLRQIKRVLAFPGVENLLLSDEEIKEFCVWPMMHQYFRKFPIHQREEYQISGELTVPFPDNLTYGAQDGRVVQKFGGTSTASSFWDIIRFNTLYGGGGSLSYSYGSGSYGTRFNFGGMRQAYLLHRNVAESYSNQYNTFRIIINDSARQIEAFSSVSAKMVVDWAKYSVNFADIKWTHMHEAIELAQAYLLFHVADASSILTDGKLDKNFNAEALKTRAQEIYDRVLKDTWLAIPDIILLRN